MYQTRPDPRTQEQHLTIDISFFPAGVQQLLTTAGVALWPQNRPQTLVWIFMKDETGAQQYVVNPPAGTGVADWQAVQTSICTLVPLWPSSVCACISPPHRGQITSSSLCQTSALHRTEALALRDLRDGEA